MVPKERTGGCHCGAIRYRIAGPIRHANHCHCTDCRRQSGAAMTTWIAVDSAALTFVEGRPKSYRSSARAVRGFCGACGSALTWQFDRRPDSIDVAAGSLDAPADISPVEHLFWDRRQPWLHLADDLPRHATWPPKRTTD